MTLLFLPMALAAVFGQALPVLPLTEGFEVDADTLRAAGWRLPATCSLVSEQPRSGRSCLRVDVPQGVDRYAELFVPVQPGRFYRAEAWVRCRDVRSHPAAGQNRGAVIFLEWADHDRQWVGGGSFPPGLQGTHDWTWREVPFTREIPPQVGYLRVLLGVEGTGTAWFDDLRVEEVTEWDGPQVLEPADGAQVETARPTLRWAVEQGRGYQVSLSRKSNFPPDETLTADAGSGVYLPQDALSPGRWFWQVQETLAGGKLPPPRSHSFIVPQGAPIWPPDVEPRWGWSQEPRPVLEAYVGPARAVRRAQVQIDGRPAKVLSLEGATLRFQPSAPLQPGLHEVNIRVWGEGDRTLATDALFCNKAAGSRVTINAANRLVVDGKPFFPLGTYRDPSDTLTDFSGLEEAGFNLTHSYYFEDQKTGDSAQAREYLQAADRHGLKVFLGLRRDRIREGDWAWCERFAGELMDEPALLTWYLMDEPEVRGVSVAQLGRLRDGLRRVDPFHPASAVFCTPGVFKAYAPACDVFWCDPYPVPGQPLTMVEKWTKAAREAAGPDKPVWIVLGAHDMPYWRASPDERKRLGESRRPTYEETRCMVFLALAAGADGLVWYWAPNSAYHIQKEAPTVWSGLVRTVHELRLLMPFLLSADDPEHRALAVPEPFRVWSRAAEGRRLLAVINSANEPAELDLELHAPTRAVVLHGSGDAVPMPEGRLRAGFAPHEVRLYEWPEVAR